MTYIMLSYFSNNEFQEYDSIIRFQYNVIGCIDGHIKEKGKTANMVKNPIWVIEENKKEYLIMYCEVNTTIKLCRDSYQKILEFEKIYNTKLTWYNCSNGYIATRLPNEKQLFIHQVIMNCYGNGKGTAIISVDHIDRDPLNNTLENLRIATQDEQRQNSKGIAPDTKRERQGRARPLPAGIDQPDMPKYVTYNVEVWDKPKNKTRDFFRIEGHPLISPKSWESTSSSKISALEKLQQTINVLKSMNAGIFPNQNTRILPKHVYLGTKHGKPVLQYDNRSASITKSMTIPETTIESDEMQRQLYIFNYRIMQSFGEEYTIFGDDYSYIGEPIEETVLDNIQSTLPMNISFYNDSYSAYTILAFQKQIGLTRITKKISLNKKYDVIEDIQTDEFTDDLQDKMVKMNREIITKWGIEHAILETDEIQEKEIQTQFQEKIIAGFPTNIYTKIQNGDLYLEYNKVILGKRMNTTIKCPKNFNKNNELHKFNHKIIELYGEEHGLNLGYYPYQTDEPVNKPENVYMNLTCSKPYLFILQNEKTVSWILPERYNLQEQIDIFINESNKISQDQDFDVDGYKLIYNNWKPDNISIIMKDGKPILAYQKRCKDCKHGLTLTLPRIAFNMNKQLIEINKKIEAKYGKEFMVL